ncbi:MAG: hypothetical protein GY725_09935 [bacterium]|nr:hypothetical protein [bacterium]
MTDTAISQRALVATAHYIVSPIYDWLLFLLPPFMALGVGALISETWFSDDQIQLWGSNYYPAALFIGVMTHAHIFAVFFRSHGNPQIFNQFRNRFLVVPLVLYLAMVSSSWVIISVSVLATFWDVYHSALQTFGFARIYDTKLGGDPTVGRRLDWWMNQLLYAGPMLAGVTMIDHFEDFQEFEDVGAVFFTSIPAFMEGNQQFVTWAVIALGASFIVYYVFAQLQLRNQGHQISMQKVFLLASTGVVSIFSWGFNTWGEAFFVMNFFHSLQYFGIVWIQEKGNMTKLFRFDGLAPALGKVLTLFVFLAVAVSYGVFVEIESFGLDSVWAITLVVSCMHFWYDGFIWSVQKHHV